MKRALLLAAVWFITVFFVALFYLSLRQPEPLAVDEVTLAPAAGCPALKVKACDKMDCNRRNMS
jgi:hypothetical protein